MKLSRSDNNEKKRALRDLKKLIEESDYDQGKLVVFYYQDDLALTRGQKLLLELGLHLSLFNSQFGFTETETYSELLLLIL